MESSWPFFTFSPDKNLKLKQERGISFEEIISAIDNGQLMDVLEHPNKAQYSNQKIYVVCVRDYIFLVPFVEDENGNIFLKTIIPSRKAKQKYIKEVKNEKKTR